MRTSEKNVASQQTTDAIKVLIADDDPPTRILLRAAISQWGYEVVEASNGEEAWDILHQPNPPRLLILDWLMPKLDGITLCTRIKQEQIQRPYTILLTQVTGTTNITKGLEAGADEFLSKPFNMAELRSRLSVGARIIRFENTLAERNKQIQEYASSMETMSQTHAKQLVYHADLLGMLGSLIEGVSQEIVDTLAKSQASNSPQFKQIQELNLNLEHVLEVIKRLQINSINTPKTENCDINRIIQHALDMCQSATKHINIVVELDKNISTFAADNQLLQETILSIILSAADALKEQQQASLKIKTRADNNNTVSIIFEDSAPAIPESELKIMLQAHLSSQDLDHVQSRLSAAMSKEVIQKCGGEFMIENRLERGTRITLLLPKK